LAPRKKIEDTKRRKGDPRIKSKYLIRDGRKR